jgi:hypothetical protein
MPLDQGAGADSSRTQLRYLEETTWGTTPSAAFTNIRATGESMTLNKGTTQSSEIRSDRQIPDLIGTSFAATGGFNFELSQDTYDDFIAGALFGAWTSDLAISAATISATATGFDDSGNGLGGVAVGQWIKVAGFTQNSGENNGYYKVTSVAAGSIDTSPVPPNTEAAGDTVTIKGSMIRNGTTAHSFSIEREHADVTQFFLFTGMMINNMSLNFSSDSVLTGSFGFDGKDVARAAVTASTGGPTAATATPITNAVSNLGSILEAGSAPSATISTLELSLANGLRGQRGIGSEGQVGIGIGQCNVSGSLNAYFSDGALYDKFRAGTNTSLSWKIEDDAGEAYVISMPNVILSDASINAGSANQDVMANFSYQAVRDATTDATVQIDRFTA